MSLKIPEITPEIAGRFWANVDKDGPVPGHRPELGKCWVWKLSLNRTGYGQFSINHLQHLAHRISYQIEFSALVMNKLICHKCDNPKCVRPSHLFSGNHAENSLDMIEKNRTNPPLGERCAAAKLTWMDIQKIKTLLERKVSQTKISKQFSVDQSIISKIKTGKIWKQKSPPP